MVQTYWIKVEDKHRGTILDYRDGLTFMQVLQAQARWLGYGHTVTIGTD